ncbi:hypothetical protein [Neolewinella agarilytica]|nr:hypothetical protein [Neolewinella agarilytica]
MQGKRFRWHGQELSFLDTYPVTLSTLSFTDLTLSTAAPSELPVLKY